MLSDTTAINNLPIVCNPSALSVEQSERWMIVGKQMYQAIQEVRELPNGFAFRLPSDPTMLMFVTEDLTIERLCCPFLYFTLEIGPEGTPLWLSFVGGEGVKEFLKISFEEAGLLDEEVAKAAGFNVSARKDIDSVDAAIEVVGAINERVAKERSSSN